MAYLPMSDRLHDRNVAPRHVYNIACAIAKRIGSNSTFNLHDKNINANWIVKNADSFTINSIDAQLKEEYKNNGGKAFKRGRPPGSRNRNTATVDGMISLEEYNALSDLPPPDDIETVYNKIVEEKSVSTEQTLVDLSKYALRTEMLEHARAAHTAAENLQRDLGGVASSIIALSDKVAAIVDNRPTIVELKKPDLPAVNLGVQHKAFPDLLMYCSAQLRGAEHLNIWIYGPAGTGKSTACKNVSIALFGKGRFYANGKISYAHELLGHMHGNKYITTQFRQAYENGGVYCADEVDGWLPDALIALNGALANGHCAFPDGMIERHPDFIFIGAANTTGLGGTMEYVSRFKQDAAFNDRCIMLEWPLDEGLEDAMCANKEWLAIVRHVRANCVRYQIKGHLVTPRAAVFGEALLAAGVDLDKVKVSVLKKGMTDNNWLQATEGLVQWAA